MTDHAAKPGGFFGRLALIVKFYEEEKYADAFRGGQLYARKLRAFRNLEDPLRGDRHEGGVLQEGGTLSVQGPSGNWWPIPTVGPLAFFSGSTDALNVFCMTGFISEEVSGPEPAMVQDVMAQVRESAATCAAMGRHAVIVWDFDEFMRRVRRACERRGYRFWARPVEYYSAYPPASVFWPEGSIKPVFMKAAGYRLQREYRIALETGTNGDEPVTLEIGGPQGHYLLLGAPELG